MVTLIIKTMRTSGTSGSLGNLEADFSHCSLLTLIRIDLMVIVIVTMRTSGSLGSLGYCITCKMVTIWHETRAGWTPHRLCTHMFACLVIAMADKQETDAVKVMTWDTMPIFLGLLLVWLPARRSSTLLCPSLKHHAEWDDV